jgi:hypothetical protein
VQRMCACSISTRFELWICIRNIHSHNTFIYSCRQVIWQLNLSPITFLYTELFALHTGISTFLNVFRKGRSLLKLKRVVSLIFWVLLKSCYFDDIKKNTILYYHKADKIHYENAINNQF